MAGWAFRAVPGLVRVMLAFEDWYRRSHRGLVESVLRAVGDPDVAGESVDEAVLRAFERWDRVATMASPGGWVFRVALNVARRDLARARRDAEEVRIAHAGRPEVEPPPGGEAWLLVDSLPLRQRTAVVLRHGAGMTEAAVAAAMGVARSTVSSTLASAHDTLRRKLVEVRLGLARECRPTGCEVEDLSTGEVVAARWSDEVRDRIKVRPGDLVALEGDEVVWRWWHGRVVAVDVDNGRATMRRRVTTGGEGDIDVAVPDGLDVTVGMTGYWEGAKTLVAVAEQELRSPPPGLRPSSGRR